MGTFLYTIIIHPLYLIIEVIYGMAYKLTGTQGLAVIGVSMGITLLCLPLYAVAERWQERERNTEKHMEPQLKRIKTTFSGDERYMMISAYYRENHYSPLMALRSSFGLLIQIPFFLAAYRFLSRLPALNGQSFLFIQNMGAPDALFRIASFPINILPIAMTLINIIAGMIYTRGFPFKEKIQIYGMALVFLVILYRSPSGLVLYWTMNNVFSLVKNVFYKVRHPLKCFWRCSCVAAAAALVYVFFFYITKPAFKALAFILALCIFLLPLMLRAVQTVIGSHLRFLMEDAKKRHLLAFSACAVLFLLTGLAIPTSLVASSPIEFSGIGSHTTPFFYLANTAVQAAGFWLFWAVALYLLFGKKIQTVCAALLCFCAVAAVLNTYLFMPSYGDISSTLRFLNAVSFQTVSPLSLANSAVLALIVALTPACIRVRRAQLVTIALDILALALTGITLVNVLTIRREYSRFAIVRTESSVSRIEPIFHLSAHGPNVFLFMLDRAQGRFVEEIMKESPDLQERFSGFTFYPNTVSFNGHTLQGAPGIYGGYEYTPAEMNRRTDTPLKQKHNEALLLLPRIFTEQKQFSATITDPSWANYSTFCDLSFLADYPAIVGRQTIGTYTHIWEQEHNADGSMDNSGSILARNMIFFSFFRQLPICLRELLYHGGSYWNSDKKAEGLKVALDNYAPLAYLRELSDVSTAENGTYNCMVNEFTHENIYMQAPDYVPAQTVTDRGTSRYRDETDYAPNMAALKRIADWLDWLKENGVYDNTRIIIVSDHGHVPIEDCMEEDAALDDAIAGNKYKGRGHYHPLLLFKDFSTNGPLRSDGRFMTNADVPALLLDGLVEKPQNPFTGNLIPVQTDAFKAGGVFISASDAHQPAYNGTYTFSIKKDEWWHVQDDIFTAANWTQAEPQGQQP